MTDLLRIKIYAGLLWLMLAITLCPAAVLGNGEKAATADNKHEKWVFMYAVTNIPPPATPERLDTTADMAVEQEHWQPSRGLELFFYRDGTFKIRDWVYGASMGLVQSFYTGTYSRNAENLSFELTFDAEQQPLASFFMRVLHDNHIDALTPLTQCNITIVEDGDENWLKAQIVCHDAKGQTYAMGRALFTREALADDETAAKPAEMPQGLTPY